MCLLKKRYWFVITVLLTLFFITRLLPAQWLIYTAQQSVRGLQVSGVVGTFWDGEASYAQWAQSGHRLPLGQLRWRVNALSLLSLNPCVSFSSHAGSQELKGEVCYSLLDKRLSASEIDSTLPMANIAPFFNVDLSGTVTAFVKRIEVGAEGFNKVDANMLWEQASIYTGTQWLAAGNIQAKLSSEAGNLHSQWQHVETNSATPLEINITAILIDVLSSKPVIKVNGLIKPGSDKAGFEPILQFIGNKNNDGSYRIMITD